MPLAAAIRRLGIACLTLVLWAGVGWGGDVACRLRLTWSGPEPGRFAGHISAGPGRCEAIRLLGAEADCPGSVWLADEGVHFRQRSAHTRDGFEFTVRGDEDAELVVAVHEVESRHGLSLVGGPTPKTLRLRLADVIQAESAASLEMGGHQFRLQRAAGDRLRVRLDRDHLVFGPNEQASLVVEPFRVGVATRTRVDLVATLHPARGADELWRHAETIEIDGAGSAAPVALAVPLPTTAGGYRLELALTKWQLRSDFWATTTLLSRRVDLAVVADRELEAPVDGEWREILSIDAANTGWWRRLAQLPQLRVFPGLGRGPIRGGQGTLRQHGDRQWTQLAADAWQAFPLAVSSPGHLHQLEIECPRDSRQSLSVTLLEPNAAGKVVPVAPDSGFYIPGESLGDAPEEGPAVLRFPFWPKTDAPLALIANRGNTPAAFGKIRLLSGPDRLSPAAPHRPPRQRLCAAYLDRPLLGETFNASLRQEPGGQAVDDWQTHYETGERLTQYLRHAGYNAAVGSVFSEGSGLAIDPQLQLTPRYGAGIQAADGADPLRKDVLELLLRKFDAAGLQWVSLIQLATPLPNLEKLRRGGEGTAEGITLVDAQGVSWTHRFPPRQGLGAYYNPLDLRVQEELTRIVRDHARRYGRHESFAGVAIQLGAHGYSLLPSEASGLDRRTVARFAAESGVKLSDAELSEPAAAARKILGQHRATWRQWRLTQIARLHQKLQEAVAAEKPEAKLLLVPIDVSLRPPVEAALRPGLPRRWSFADAAAGLGWDNQAAAAPGIVALRPYRVRPPADLPHEAVNLELNAAADVDRFFLQSSVGGAAIFHEPQQQRFPAFDEQSPFGPENTLTWLVSPILPAGAAARRPLAHALARRDLDVLLHGSWLLPLGQEAELAGFLATLSALPAGPFETIEKTEAGQPLAMQPLVLRRKRLGQWTVLYLLNDSPWPLEIALDLDSSANRIVPLGPARELAPLKRIGNDTHWTTPLAAYELLAVALDSPSAKVLDVSVVTPPDARKQLASQLEAARDRIERLSGPQPLPVLRNAGFEENAADVPLPGWTAKQGPKLEIGARTGASRGGQRSLVMRSAANAPCWVRSDAFAPPTTGRISVSVWLRTPRKEDQPTLRLAIDARYAGQTYYRYATVGAGTAAQLQSEWAPYVFQVDDLPTSGLSDLQVGFDLMGPGEAWIDEVQVYDLSFDKNERIELTKILGQANFELGQGNLADCRRLVEGYWPRFLREAIPGDGGDLQPRTARHDDPGNSAPPAPGIMDRLRRLTPPILRLR